MVLCRVCETLVVVTATMRSKESLKAAYRLSVDCPICESLLSMETNADVDTSTVALLGFECKSGASKPKYRMKGAPPAA
jgi:hypothetical protein